MCHNVVFEVELDKFVADHDFCLEIKYEEQHQPRVIIEKADALKGSFCAVQWIYSDIAEEQKLSFESRQFISVQFITASGSDGSIVFTKFFSVNTITYEPIHIAWWNFAWTVLSTYLDNL